MFFGGKDDIKVLLKLTDLYHSTENTTGRVLNCERLKKEILYFLLQVSLGSSYKNSEANCQIFISSKNQTKSFMYFDLRALGQKGKYLVHFLKDMKVQQFVFEFSWPLGGDSKFHEKLNEFFPFRTHVIEKLWNFW